MRNYNALSLFNRTPYKPFFDVWENFDKDFFGEYSTATPAKMVSYDMRLNSEKSQWELTLELAGVTKDKLKLDVKEGLLTISGEKTKGLNTGNFEHALKVPEGVDYEKIEADFTDGVLSLSFPLIEKKTAKRIELK